MHGSKLAKAKEVLVDTTVQEKNITFPTDAKLYKKVIEQCNTLAQRAGVQLRESYRYVAQKLFYLQRYVHLPRHVKKARKALKRLKNPSRSSSQGFTKEAGRGRQVSPLWQGVIVNGSDSQAAKKR